MTVSLACAAHDREYSTATECVKEWEMMSCSGQLVRRHIGSSAICYDNWQARKRPCRHFGAQTPTGATNMPQPMKCTPPPCPNADLPGARHTPHRDASTDLSTAISLACVTGFQEARERLLAQFESGAPGLAPTLRVRQPGGCAVRYTRWAHPLETSFHWLLSAAALGGVLLGVLSL